MAKIKLFILFVFFLFSQSFGYDFNRIPTGEEYIIGEDGIKRIYINVWGHVKNPGPYLVYKDVDLITLLSIAGGPLDGANLSKIRLIKQNNNINKIIDINEFEKHVDNNFQPYDTIIIKPTLTYYVTKNSSIINTILSIITLGITLDNL